MFIKISKYGGPFFAMILWLFLPGALSANSCPQAILTVNCQDLGPSTCRAPATTYPRLTGYDWQGLGCVWQGTFSVYARYAPVGIAPRCGVSTRLGIVNMNQRTFFGTTRVYPEFTGYQILTVPYTNERVAVCTYRVTTSGPYP